jgi:sugar phosphate isomerase/epimerase
MPPMMYAADTTPRLGVDLFSLRSQKWTPFESLDYCAKLGAKLVHFSELQYLGSLDEANLIAVRDHAKKLDVAIEVGTRTFCPTSKSFDPKQGTAEEQMLRALNAARVTGSPIVRTFMGTSNDRDPIERHMEAMTRLLKSMRSRITDLNLKIAIENHAGDMQARELKGLIEAAGPDYVGVCLDSGNPVWTIEDPHLTLETLAPYVHTSHMRDSYLFNSPRGIAVQWTRMGDGNMGIEDYIRTYVQKCPGKAVSLEVIVSPSFRIFNYRDPQAWELFKTTPAWEFSRFLALADRGIPKPLPDPGQGPDGGDGQPARPPAGVSASRSAAPAGMGTGRGAAVHGAERDRGNQPNQDAQRRNLEDVEASVKWTQKFLATL